MASCEAYLERFRTQDLYCNFNIAMGVQALKKHQDSKEAGDYQMIIVTQFLKNQQPKVEEKKELKMRKRRNTNYTLQQYYFPKDE